MAEKYFCLIERITETHSNVDGEAATWLFGNMKTFMV